MWAFVDPGRESRVLRAITFLLHILCTGFFNSDEHSLPSWVVHPLQSLPKLLHHLPLSLLWLQSGRAWCFVDEGMVDITVLPEISDRVLEALCLNVLW